MDIFWPFAQLAETVAFTWLNLEPKSYLGEAINFFVYDSLKIGLLLIIINYLMAIVRYYFPMEKVRDFLTQKRLFGFGYVAAVILGTITPFCSCSSIPLFIGFLSAGIPLGITFTFLISSPLINESSLFLFPSLFGLKTTILYNLVGATVSIAGGLLLQKLKMEKYIEPAFLKFKNRQQTSEAQEKQPPLTARLLLWWNDGLEITKKIFPYVILGVALGAVIHGFVPQALVEQYLGTKTWWSVPLAVVLGIPLYANSVSVVPIIQALVGKGIPLGTALAFMTATVTLSIPEALMLKKAMKLPLLAAFFGITIMGIMLMGFLFNIL